MTQYKNKTIIVLTVGLSILFMTSGCEKSKLIVRQNNSHDYAVPAKKGPPPWAPAHGYRAKHRYSYYPSSYVYFDTGRNLFFYYEGDQWKISASLPVGIKIDMNDYVTLEMDTDKPYQFHSEVVKKYPPGQQKKKGKDKEKGKKTKAKKKENKT